MEAKNGSEHGWVYAGNSNENGKGCARVLRRNERPSVQTLWRASKRVENVQQTGYVATARNCCPRKWQEKEVRDWRKQQKKNTPIHHQPQTKRRLQAGGDPGKAGITA